MVIVRAGQMLTGGSGSFPVEPSWPATLAHGANVVAAVLSGRFLLLDRRVRRGVCAKCGRERKVPPAADAARWLRPLAVLTRSEEHTSELQSRGHLVCRLLLEKKKKEMTKR